MEKASHLLTIGDSSQFPGMFKGIFVKGHREPRIAVVGRSNVGKSTLINALLGAQLARTSKQPGKTRAIHFYHWREAKKILVDLPGYGYARAAKEERQRWETFIHSYFQEETHLDRVILILDARQGPSTVDLQAIEFLSLRAIPVTFVFAKVDKLKTQAQRALRQKETAQALKTLGYSSSPCYWVSSVEKRGIKELKKILISEYKPEHKEDGLNA